MLEERVRKDTEVIVTEFADLIGSTSEYFNSKAVDPKKIARNIFSIAPSDELTHSLLNSLNIENSTTIDDIILHLQQKSYISFFNYHIVEYLIKEYGSPEDQQKLDAYTTKFKKFCQRSVFQVPQRAFGEAPEGSTVLAIKILRIPSTFTISQRGVGDASARAPPTVIASSHTLKFSLEHTRAVQAKIADAIGMKQSWALVLLNASKGCVELTFALPSVIMDEMVKPLFNNRASPSGLLNLEAEGIYILCGPPGKPIPTSITNDSISLKWEKPEYQGYHSHSHYCIFY